MTRIASIAALLMLVLHARAQDFPEQVGRIRHFALQESSGLTTSSRYAGVLWTHNDEQQTSGRHFLFAMNKKGRVIGAFAVAQNLIDWEDIASDGKGNLYLADIGTNGMQRSHVAVHRVREPNPFKKYGNVTVDRTWLLRFPERTRPDCEAFFVHGRFGYIINKFRVSDGVNEFVNLYRFSLFDTRRSIPLKRVARIPIEHNAAAADLSDDGQRLALVTSHAVYLYFVNGNPRSADTAERLRFDFEGENNTREGGTFVGAHFLACAESREIWEFTNSKFLCQDPPRFLGVPLEDLIVDAGVSFDFAAFPDACPRPQLIWRFNGQPIAGATNSTLSLSNVSPAQAGLYEAVAFNRYGSATNAATLTVKVRTGPDVRITEVMSARVDDQNVQTADWWELTNFEPVPVDLSGWRFNDNDGGLADAFTIPAGTVLQPGETLILVENLTPTEFRSWWGGFSDFVQIVTYTGSGLSFSGDGDQINLWNNLDEPVASVEFGVAVAGVSFVYNIQTEQLEPAQLGVNGVHQAQTTTDIGSPGLIIGF